MKVTLLFSDPKRATDQLIVFAALGLRNLKCEYTGESDEVAIQLNCEWAAVNIHTGYAEVAVITNRNALHTVTIPPNGMVTVVAGSILPER